MGIIELVARTYPLHQAKARFSELVKLAESGEEIEIMRHGKVVARLVAAAPVLRRPGSATGTIWVENDDWSFESLEFTDAEIDEMFPPEEYG